MKTDLIMANKLSEKDVRTLKIGAICVAAILAFTFGPKWLNHWGQVRNSLARLRASLQQINANDPRQAALLSIVPVFETPQPEEEQMFLFRDKFNEQLKKAGIKTEPLQVLPPRKSGEVGYKLLRLKCTGKCKFEQMLDLLANLKENPYLVGVEEIRISCDPKEPPDKRKEIEIDLTVSTFVK